MAKTNVTLTSRHAVYSRPSLVTGQQLAYEVLTTFDAPDRPSLRLTGWTVERHLEHGKPPVTRTVSLDAQKAANLYRLLNTCYIQKLTGYANFGLLDVVLGRSGVINYSRPTVGRPVKPTAVTAGMPCVIIDSQHRPVQALIGLGPNLGFSHLPRSLGPAIICIDDQVKHRGLHGVMQVL